MSTQLIRLYGLVMVTLNKKHNSIRCYHLENDKDSAENEYNWKNKVCKYVGITQSGKLNINNLTQILYFRGWHNWIHLPHWLKKESHRQYILKFLLRRNNLLYKNPWYQKDECWLGVIAAEEKIKFLK